MAIKIECSQCGFKNDLGRVFCEQCSQKLDMTRTAMVDMKNRREFEFGKFVGRSVGWVAFLSIAALLGLALWPVPPTSVLMDPAGLHQIPAKMGAVKKALAARKGVSVNFGEDEVNGYLVARARNRKLVSLTVDFKPGKFELEARMDWRPPVTNLTWLARARLPLNCRLTGAFEEGRFVVRRTHLGRLPMIGPAMAPVQDFFAGIFNDVVNEKVLVESLKRVTLDDSGVDVGFGK
jgi:hypothetical protein